MDLSYGAEYESFRAQVRDFIAKHKDDAPRGKSQKKTKSADTADKSE